MPTMDFMPRPPNKPPAPAMKLRVFTSSQPKSSRNVFSARSWRFSCAISVPASVSAAPALLSIKRLKKFLVKFAFSEPLKILFGMMRSKRPTAIPVPRASSFAFFSSTPFASAFCFTSSAVEPIAVANPRGLLMRYGMIEPATCGARLRIVSGSRVVNFSLSLAACHSGVSTERLCAMSERSLAIS